MFTFHTYNTKTDPNVNTNPSPNSNPNPTQTLNPINHNCKQMQRHLLMAGCIRSAVARKCIRSLSINRRLRTMCVHGSYNYCYVHQGPAVQHTDSHGVPAVNTATGIVSTDEDKATSLSDYFALVLPSKIKAPFL